jgi:hypothetical protein
MSKKYLYNANPSLSGTQYLSTLTGQPQDAPTEGVQFVANGASDMGGVTLYGTGLGDSINALGDGTLTAIETTGSNLFSFGSGLDSFTGGTGANTFAFFDPRSIYAGSGTMYDTITDFHGHSGGVGHTPGQDFIDFFGYAPGTSLQFDYYGASQAIQYYSLISPTSTVIGTFIVDMAGSGSGGGNYYLLGPGDYGFLPLCFGAGTLIATPSGQVAVESLSEGDLVLTASGEAMPVRWIGRRTADARESAAPEEVWPVRISAGAFGPGLPARDLTVSPRHALFIDGHLIPAISLVNGRSIRQVHQDRVAYFHIELDRHAAVLAEGLPAESYLETGCRGIFENAETNVMALPDLSYRAYLAGAFAPYVAQGPVVERVRLGLLQRLPELGHAPAPAHVLRQVESLAA